jgi:exodeoxyribonuclease VII small subunit
MENKEPTFEEALARLEEIVRALESGQSKLEDSLALYEEGIRLARACNEKLDGAEQKIKMLSIDPAAAQQA